MDVIFYKFNNNNQDTEVVKCKLEQAEGLFEMEIKKFDEGRSDFNYFDISSVEGRMLKSFKG